MPNWVDNNLTIYGTKEQIEKVKGQVSQTTTSWWENKKESEKPIELYEVPEIQIVGA